MESYLLKLGTCNCGSIITADQMISQNRVRCSNCPAEHEVHIDLTYIPTLEELEQYYQEQQFSQMEEDADLPF